MGLEDRIKAIQPEPEPPRKIIVQSKAPVIVPTDLLPRFDNADQEAKLRGLALSVNATAQLQTLLAFVQNEGLCRGSSVDSGTFFSPSRTMPWIDSAALEIRSMPSPAQEGSASDPSFGVIFQAAPPGLAFYEGATLSMHAYLDLSAQKRPLFLRVREAMATGQNSRILQTLENNTFIVSHTFSNPNNMLPGTLEDDLVVLYQDGFLGKKRRFHYGYFEPKPEAVKDPNLKLVQYQDYRRLDEPDAYTHRPYITDPTKGHPSPQEGTRYSYWDKEFVPSLNVQRGLYNQIIEGDVGLKDAPETGSIEPLSPDRLLILDQQPPIIDSPEELKIRDRLVQAFSDYGVSRRMDVLAELITSYQLDPKSTKLYYSINPYLNLYFLNYLYTRDMSSFGMEREYWTLPGVAQETPWVRSRETGRRIQTDHGSRQFLISLAIPVFSEKILPPQIHIKSIKNSPGILTASKTTTATVFQPREGEEATAITELDDQVFYLIQKSDPDVLPRRFKRLPADQKKRLVVTYLNSKEPQRPPKPQWMVDKDNELRIAELKGYLKEVLTRANAIGSLKELTQRWGEIGNITSHDWGLVNRISYGYPKGDAGYSAYWSYAFPTPKFTETVLGTRSIGMYRANYNIGLTISAEMSSFQDSPDTASIIISYEHGLGSQVSGKSQRKLLISELTGDGREQIHKITLELMQDIEKAKAAPKDLYRKNSIWWRRLFSLDKNS